MAMTVCNRLRCICSVRSTLSVCYPGYLQVQMQRYIWPVLPGNYRSSLVAMNSDHRGSVLIIYIVHVVYTTIHSPRYISIYLHIPVYSCIFLYIPIHTLSLYISSTLLYLFSPVNFQPKTFRLPHFSHLGDRTTMQGIRL